jgi:transcriptional regulator with GAF, ATPase, and Fis domain
MSSSFFINPRSNPELRSLFQIISLPHPQAPIQDYFHQVMTILSESFPITYCALLVQDPKKDFLNVEGVYGIEKEQHPNGCGSQKGIISKTLQSRQPLVIHDLNQEPLYEDISKAGKHIEKIRLPILCIPVIAENEPIGVLNISTLYGPRDELAEDFQFLSILSAILAPAIRNYQARKEESLAKPSKGKTKSKLEDFLGERLAEVLDKIDPYVESKMKSGLLDDIISMVERILIQSALERVGHVQVAAAQLLGINRNTLRKKMKDLRIKSRAEK